MKNLFFALIASATLVSCTTDQSNRLLILPSLFSDHMVVQQNDTMLVWGETMPGAPVSITASWGGLAEIKADADGKWRGKLGTPAAGGPFSIQVAVKDTSIVLNDVMAGEVWLASGQSNMSMPLKGWPPADLIVDDETEIANADFPGIRMFTVVRAVEDSPAQDVSGTWQVCNPDNAPDFSATAYFFARELHKELGVPVGIIHSSWGGTPAESWVSENTLREIKDFEETIEKLKASRSERKKINTWMEKMPVVDLANNTGEDFPEDIDLKDEQASSLGLDDSGWYAMKLPGLWEYGALGDFDGVVWLRKEIELMQEPAASKLSLGPIDDMDIVYINGVRVGGILKSGYYSIDRLYHIPEGLMKKGKNTIAVKVIDTGGGGGIYGKPEKMFVDTGNEKISLAGEWKYLPTAEFLGGKLYLYGVEKPKFPEKPACSLSLTAYTPTALFNAMIAPLISYKIKGVIWYQGESNVGRGVQYEQLFPALIKDWRRQWNAELPFFYAQISPFAYQDFQKEQSPALREAQRRTMTLPKTGMAVTLDIGDNQNIHPGNKQEVGRRLALWALSGTYGREKVCSGPLYKDHVAEADKIVVSFRYAESGLRQKGKTLKGFEVAGEDKVFSPAKAFIRGNNVVAWSENVKSPAYVRYAWSDTAEATLFNAEGLPASSFESYKVSSNYQGEVKWN